MFCVLRMLGNTTAFILGPITRPFVLFQYFFLSEEVFRTLKSSEYLIPTRARRGSDSGRQTLSANPTPMKEQFLHTL